MADDKDGWVSSVFGVDPTSFVSRAADAVGAVVGEVKDAVATVATGAVAEASTLVDQGSAAVSNASQTIKAASTAAVSTAKKAAGEVGDGLAAAAGTIQSALPTASAALDDLSGAPLNSPSYVNGQAPPSLQGGPTASAGDSTFVTGIPKNSLLDKGKAVYKAGQDLIKLGTDIEKKGKHTFSSNETDLLATGKTLQDCGKTYLDLASAVDRLAGNANEGAIKGASKYNTYIGNLLNALDTVAAVRTADLAVDAMAKKPSQASVEAWADSVGNLFDKAGSLIDIIPDDFLPGFIKDYYKGLFSAPKNYITAFKKIMHAHYAMVDEEGHMPSPANEQAYDLHDAKTVWEGALTSVFVGAAFQPKLKDGDGLAEFMTKHRDEDGLDLYKATIEAGKAALGHRVEAYVTDPDDGATRAAWLAYLS